MNGYSLLFILLPPANLLWVLVCRPEWLVHLEGNSECNR
jgi:hypothetical protein